MSRPTSPSTPRLSPSMARRPWVSCSCASAARRVSPSIRSRSTATSRAPLDLAERPGGLLRLERHLARLHAYRLEMALHPLVLARRLLEILLAREALCLARAHGLVEPRDARAGPRHLCTELGHGHLRP